MQYSIPYRRDIDGLRAFAVLSVVFYHYGVPGFGGGFSGVDVFFVISGFLIAGHIADEIRARRFSLIAFYERRIRRIFPALFFMYALVLLACALILFPPDLAKFSGMGIYVVPFLANFEFYKVSGGYSGFYPQRIVWLHTWSLAIEEQFYLLFPLLMLAMARLAAPRRQVILASLGLLSLLLCIVAVRIKPSAAFYLLPFRAWELLLGALLATGGWSAPQNPRMRGGLALLGLALIAASDVLLDSDTLFPSEYTLLPCGGAALILYAACDRTQPVGRILDNPVAVRIGLWSYSLYLFHWPLLVLAKYYAFEPLSFGARLLILAATFALAALSWRFVEQPFRGRKGLFSRGSLFVVAAASGAALMLAAFALHWAGANPKFYTPEDRLTATAFNEVQQHCKDFTPHDGARQSDCKLGDTAAPITALLWGDSHALALLPAIDAAFLKHGSAADFAERGGCPPLFGVQVMPVGQNPAPILRTMLHAAHLRPNEACKAHNDSVIRWLRQHRIGTVILAAHWRVYTDPREKLLDLSDAQLPYAASPSNNETVFRRDLVNTLETLQQLHERIFVLDDTPEIGVDVPYALESEHRLGERRELGISPSAYEIQQQAVTRIFAELQKRYPFQILRPEDLLCRDKVCAAARDGRPLYIDEEHLSPFGALFVQAAFDPIWQNPR